METKKPKPTDPMDRVMRKQLAEHSLARVVRLSFHLPETTSVEPTCSTSQRAFSIKIVRRSLEKPMEGEKKSLKIPNQQPAEPCQTKSASAKYPIRRKVNVGSLL